MLKQFRIFSKQEVCWKSSGIMCYITCNIFYWHSKLSVFTVQLSLTSQRHVERFFITVRHQFFEYSSYFCTYAILWDDYLKYESIHSRLFAFLVNCTIFITILQQLISFSTLSLNANCLPEKYMERVYLTWKCQYPVGMFSSKIEYII